MAAVAADAAILHEGSVIEAQIKAGVGLVLSRGISGLGNPLTMVPFLDFANHASTNSNNGPCSFESTHKWYADSNALHSYDQSTRSFSLIATRDIDVGEDICISYGNGRSTESFMALYGFPGVPDILDSQDSQHKIDKAGESDLDWSNSSCIDAKQEKEQCLNVILPYYLAVLNENDNISIVVETLAGDISKVLYSLKELGATRPSKLPDSSLDLHSILTSLCHDYGNKLKRSLGEERVEDSLLKLSIEPGHDKTASLIPWIRLMHLLLLQSHQSQLPVTMRSLKKCLRLINQSLDKQLPMGLTLVKLPDYPSISDVDDSSAINKLRTLLLLVVDRNSWYGSSRSLCKEDDRYSDASSGGEDWFRSCDVALFLQHTPLVIMKHICEVLEEYINRADDVR